MKIENCMTPRLLTIADCVQEGSRLADVGTDHAYIPIYLAQKGIIPSAVAMDINVGPIRRAQENIRKYHLENQISTRLSDGLKELCPGEADEIVIAGMGGILICEILDAGRKHWQDSCRFLLQPMTAAEELRKFLENNGFCIEREALAAEEGKIYQIICAVRGNMHMNHEIDYYISPYLRECHVPLTKQLTERRIAEFEKMLDGLSKCERAETKEKYQYVKSLLKELYSVREECETWQS